MLRGLLVELARERLVIEAGGEASAHHPEHALTMAGSRA